LIDSADIILASASPRRKRLLEQVGLRVHTVPSNLPEENPAGYDLVAFVRDMARKKARYVAAKFPECLVLGADTLVICDNQSLGKPKDAREATDMLTRLSGNWHRVITGICLVQGAPDQYVVDHAVTDVRFFSLSTREIAEYVQSGEPFDKAGAYGIQGLAARFVREIRGCFFNVVGLPLGVLWQYIKPLYGD
jgi:septum formation protein